MSESTTDPDEDAADADASPADAKMGEEPAAAADERDPAAAADERDPEEVVDDLEKPLLLFDGVCNLCNGFVRFVVKFDDEGTFLFAPLQSDVGQEVLERHDMPTEDFETFVLVEDGEIHTKSGAALRVMGRLDGPWPLLGPLLYLPRGVRDFGYDLVANNRYRLFGKKDECPLPPPELRERFANRTLE